MKKLMFMGVIALFALTAIVVTGCHGHHGGGHHGGGHHGGGHHGGGHHGGGGHGGGGH